jgi:hypothetical protein
MRPDLDRCAVCGPQLAVPIRIDDEPSHSNRPLRNRRNPLSWVSPSFCQRGLSWRRLLRACQWTLSRGPDDKCHPSSVGACVVHQLRLRQLPS